MDAPLGSESYRIAPTVSQFDHKGEIRVFFAFAKAFITQFLFKHLSRIIQQAFLLHCNCHFEFTDQIKNNEMNEFLELFSKEELSVAIQKLAKKFFEERMWIADGMELSANGKDDLKYTILDEQKCQVYESRFLIFGQATHSGSSYAFLKTPGAKNCDEWPILVLGDEGGAVVLARNIFDLMRFWTLDSVQPYVNTSDYRSFDLWLDQEEEEDDEGNEEYKAWILSEFGINPLQSIEEAEKQIIQPAIDIFQKEMDEIFEN